MLALVLALGLGLAGGLNLHRFVDLEETGTLLLHGLQSSYRWARKEVGTRIASLTKQPVTVAQANSPSAGVGQPARTEPQTADIVDRIINDLSGRVDQIRAANESAARGLNEGFERLRITADQSQREVIANLARLNERLDRIERQSAAGTVPMVTPAPTQPVVQSSAPPPSNASVQPLQQPTPDTNAKPNSKQASTSVTKPRADARGIAAWTVREARIGRALLNGPRGLLEVRLGDNIPGIGRVEAILRSGRRWVVATTLGVITPE